MNTAVLRRRDELLERLLSGARTLGVELSQPTGERLLAYIDLLLQWNRAFNLTAITDPDRMVSHHLLDSLAIATHLRGQRILDVGTGAGLPGIPLSLALPGKDFHLLDSNGKKTRFLIQARASLRLDNVTIHNERSEAFRDAAGFDTVVARAVASLGELAAGAGHLLAAGGVLLAMKAELAPGEIRTVAAPYNVATCVSLEVPGIERRRQLVRIERTGLGTGSDGHTA